MDELREENAAREGADEPPPIGGSWTRLYTAVLVALALLIAAFVTLTRHFS